MYNIINNAEEALLVGFNYLQFGTVNPDAEPHIKEMIHRFGKKKESSYAFFLCSLSFIWNIMYNLEPHLFCKTKTVNAVE